MSSVEKEEELKQEEDNQFMGQRGQKEFQQPQNQHSEPQHLAAIMPQRTIQVKKKDQAKKLVKGVEDNPEYFRVDLEVTHKLYEIYRRVKIVNSEQYLSSSFEEKEQGNNTINYHKIMQMLKDINFKLEINQKLQVLRAIKKFCFNQNFINEEEFVKIFKVIVHGIGIKEATFKSIISNKYSSIVEKDLKVSNQRKAASIKVNKNFGKKMKTESQMESSQLRSQFNKLLQEQTSFQTVVNNDYSHIKSIPTVNPSAIIEQSIEAESKTARKHDNSRRRMATDVSRYDAEKGYLNRAIEKNKLGKLTWDNLFKMTEENMHYNIVVPSFVTKDLTLNDMDF